MVRIDGKPSLSATFAFISFNISIFCILLFVATTISKLTGFFSITDANQTSLLNAFQAAFQLFIACSALYFGRRITKKGDTLTVKEKEE